MKHPHAGSVQWPDVELHHWPQVEQRLQSPELLCRHCSLEVHVKNRTTDHDVDDLFRCPIDLLALPLIAQVQEASLALQQRYDLRADLLQSGTEGVTCEF